MTVVSAAEALVRLCGWLRLPIDPTLIDSLSVQHFKAWKPLAERIARAQEPYAEALAELLVTVAKTTSDGNCLGLALWTAGNIYHNLNLMQLAHHAYQQADAIYTTLDDAHSAARMSVGWIHVLGELGACEEALARAKKAEEIIATSDDPKDKERLANLYGNVGIVCEQMGQLVDALANYERKWHFFREFMHRDIDATLDGAMSLNDIGIVQTLLGQYTDAERTFTHTLDIVAPHMQDQLVWADVTLVLMNRAWLTTLRRSPYDLVRKAFQAARNSRNKLDEKVALQDFAYIELEEAHWLIQLGLWHEVDRSLIERLETFAIQEGIPFEATYAKLLVGQLDFYVGKTQDAYTKFAQIEQNAVGKTPVIGYLAKMWQARALWNMGDLLAAEQMLEQAIHIIEQARHRLTKDDYRASYLEDKLAAYQDLIQLHLTSCKDHCAFSASERIKARTLTEVIATKKRYAPIKSDPSISSQILPEDIAAKLSSGTIAVSYAVVQDHVWAFLLDKHGMVDRPQQLTRCLSRSELEQGLRSIQRIAGLSQPTDELWRKQLVQAQKPLKNWYASYVAPLKPWLEQYERILISPDGLLNALPFACLYDEQAGQYLAETHELTFAPSLGIWSLLSAGTIQHQYKPEQQVLVVGNSSKDGMRGKLPRTLDEARTVAQLFSNYVLLLEDEATFKQFTHSASQADLIYIAAHGEYRIGEPASSFIELADQPLSVSDILDLTLRNATVVLSACETSKGYSTGNEMMGLVRAFLYAGAQTVVANHWPVEDSITFSLMTKFMQEVQAGHSLAWALKHVQSEFISAKDAMISHPFYWGALAIIGAENAWIAVD